MCWCLGMGFVVCICDHRGFVTRWNQRRCSVERDAYCVECLGCDRLMVIGIVELVVDCLFVSWV